MAEPFRPEAMIGAVAPNDVAESIHATCERIGQLLQVHRQHHVSGPWARAMRTLQRDMDGLRGRMARLEGAELRSR